MDQVKADTQNAVNNAKQSLETRGRQTVDDIKQIPPQVWGVSFGLAFLVIFVLNIITKKKEDAVFSAAILFYTTFVGALSIFLRNHQLDNQFKYMLVLLSVARVFFTISPVSVLLISFLPFIVNTVAAELKTRGIIPA